MFIFSRRDFPKKRTMRDVISKIKKIAVINLRPDAKDSSVTFIRYAEHPRKELKSFKTTGLSDHQRIPAVPASPVQLKKQFNSPVKNGEKAKSFPPHLNPPKIKPLKTNVNHNERTSCKREAAPLPNFSISDQYSSDSVFYKPKPVCGTTLSGVETRASLRRLTAYENPKIRRSSRRGSKTSSTADFKITDASSNTAVSNHGSEGNCKALVTAGKSNSVYCLYHLAQLQVR